MLMSFYVMGTQEDKGTMMTQEALPMIKTAPPSPPRTSEAQKSKLISHKYKGSPRIYYCYQLKEAMPTLVYGTDHKATAKLFVQQREALGHALLVYCAKPALGTSTRVYCTGEKI